MAKITIGKVEYLIPEFNFAAVERAWPYIQEATLTLDPMKGPAAGLRIIAAGLMEAGDFDPSKFGIKPEEELHDDDIFERMVTFFKKQLLAVEIVKVKTCIDEILEEAGLAADDSGEVEAAPMKEASPSLETAASSSQSSSPQDAREAAGTA